MTRKTFNTLVDGTAFAGFLLLAASGVLMRYVLPPGSGRFATVWGLDRHAWGALHFWIAGALLAVLGLHLLLHWRWISVVVRGTPREASGRRAALGLVGILALLGLALAPLVSPVERRGRTAGTHGSVQDRTIRGPETLRRAAAARGLDPADILLRLGLPADAPVDEPLGPWLRLHGLSMHDLRQAVDALEEAN
jgi:hypothetical protein